MKHFSQTRLPTIFLILGAILISFSGVWVKLAHVTPTSSAFYRVFFGFVFLVFLSYRTKDHSKHNVTQLLLAALCGLLFALDLLCWHNSILLIGPGLATLLGNFQVFVLAGVGILFLKEAFSIRLLLSIPLAITGLFFIIGPDWQTMGEAYKDGIYFGFATALLYSAFLLTLRHLSGLTDKYFTMMLISLISSIILACYIYYSGDSFVIPDLQSFASLACLGLFSQCIGWLLITVSLPQCKASYAGLILLLQPTLAFIWDVVFFSRATSTLNWFGVAFTLASIYLGISAREKKS